jgi:hypothetical protein
MPVIGVAGSALGYYERIGDRDTSFAWRFRRRRLPRLF